MEILIVALVVLAVLAVIGGAAWWLLFTDFTKMDSQPAGQGVAATEQPRAAGPESSKIICQFCQTPGSVTVRRVRRVKRKTATRIAGAVVTAGGSLGVTGVSKKGTVTELSCSNCGMKWDAPLAKP